MYCKKTEKLIMNVNTSNCYVSVENVHLFNN